MKVRELIELLRNVNPDLEVMVAPMSVYPSLNDPAPPSIPDPMDQSPVVQVSMYREMLTSERKEVAVIGFQSGPRREPPKPEEFVN